MVDERQDVLCVISDFVSHLLFNAGYVVNVVIVVHCYLLKLGERYRAYSLYSFTLYEYPV